MNYSYLLFDFDGTLADSYGMVLAITHTLLRRHGITKVEPEHFRDRDNLPVTQKMRMLSFMMKIRPEFIALYGENLEKIHLFDGMLELLLACCKRGYRIAVLSSNAVENIRAFFERYPLPFELEIVSSNGLFGKHKTIKEFAKDHGVTVSDLLYIGDEIRDVKTCNRCGADVVFVRWGLDAGANLEEFEVQYEVDTPKALAELLLSKEEAAKTI